MKPLLRPVVWVLIFFLLLTLGCSALRSCLQSDEPDVLADEKEALWEKLIADRPTGSGGKEPALKVVVIDVGQGDSILLVSPEGRTMLVDAGPADAFSKIVAALHENGVTALDAIVATHPHGDHIGSMAAVLDAYEVGAYYTIATDPSDAGDAGLSRALQEEGCPVVLVNGGMTIPWSESCTATVLNPIAAYESEPAEMNDRSVVLNVRYGDTAVLLAGDAEAVAEKRMLDTFPKYMLKANVLKLGHHGSSSSTGYSFFLAVDPDYAVASCGEENDYGHPHLETLSLLYDTCTALYRTDRDGTVTFLLDGKTVSVKLP